MSYEAGLISEAQYVIIIIGKQFIQNIHLDYPFFNMGGIIQGVWMGNE